MIDLKLLNSIPRPDGWGEFEVANFGFVFTQLLGTRTRVQVYLAGLQISLVESGGDPTPPDGPAGFAPHLQYLRTGWLPIETAPMDGTTVDLLINGTRAADYFWRQAPGSTAGWRYWIPGGIILLDLTSPPTHWRPLPCSPSST